jgi:hypothetical protein
MTTGTMMYTIRITATTTINFQQKNLHKTTYCVVLVEQMQTPTTPMPMIPSLTGKSKLLLLLLPKLGVNHHLTLRRKQQLVSMDK